MYMFPTSYLAELLQHLFIARTALLDYLDNLLELGRARVAYALVQPALARAHSGTLMAQPGEGNGHLLLVAAADAVGHDVDHVAVAEQVEGGLSNADVRFDADDDAGEGRGKFCHGGADAGGPISQPISRVLRV
jgi:hypothetical protein